jgi:hypothetical protein
MPTIRSTAARTDLTAALGQLIGKECWSVIGGRGTGSVIVMSLGERVPREREISNPSLTEDERRFDALFSSMIWCSWRVERAGRVVGTWVALTETGELEPTEVLALRGRRLSGFELDDPIPDLRLDFGDVRLSLFADYLSDDPGEAAYTVATPTGTYSVLATGEIYFEHYEQEDGQCADP